MSNQFKVGIRTAKDEYGYIVYDLDNKTVQVVLANEKARQDVENYLAGTYVIPSADQTLLDFQETTVEPTSSLDNLKLALTRMWGKTGVYVDWSHPVP
ncbi:Hypothetical protein LUCI_2159 [Lucifera butyrica]|uniref:Uncharacterized protein n=1 Tax=Lucifera butyrica TaxID=1351585 RepID=A0A498R6U0_9FIRM|nr:hypothetical protein [Lucifera butyrica]VBB06919.1 Hypothetical protein LUCI_2159 [Lucifera butyrica]